ncbi:MAG: hypothetical protein U0Z26_07060 [Anaerolineales bacterium]
MKLQVLIKKNIPLLAVIIVFILSRFAYYQQGIRFQGETYKGYWQFIEETLLKTDLTRNVFYLHSQPPLFNLFTGIILQLFPTSNEVAFKVIYYFAGLILAVSIYFLGNALGFRSTTSAILSSIFIISPSSILYENWLSYAYPLATMLTLSGVFLYRYVKAKKTSDGIYFFLLLATISLTWGLFHLIWVLAFAIIFLIIFKFNFKTIAISIFIPILLTVSWYTKNLVLYGEFTASSWAGMNLANITTFRLSQKERKQLQKEGILSNFATIIPFRNPDVYLKFIKIEKTGVPILDDSLKRNKPPSFSIYSSVTFYLKDAITVIRIHPIQYVQSILQANYIYFHSTQ